MIKRESDVRPTSNELPFDNNRPIARGSGLIGASLRGQRTKAAQTSAKNADTETGEGNARSNDLKTPGVQLSVLGLAPFSAVRVTLVNRVIDYCDYLLRVTMVNFRESIRSRIVGKRKRRRRENRFSSTDDRFETPLAINIRKNGENDQLIIFV